jgi:hypothetical protein
VTTETVTVPRETEEGETITCWDWCGEGEAENKGPLIEYVSDTADVDVAPQSEFPTVHFYSGSVASAEDLLLINRGDDEWLKRGKLLQWVT